MDLSHILQSDKYKNRKRVGRGPGSGTGKTSGRGEKGQKSRSGSKSRFGFEGGQMPLYRRLPKRGFNPVRKKEFEIVNTGALNVFDEKSTVGPDELWAKGLIGKKDSLVKILGTGDLEKNLTVKAHKFSGTAVEKIESQKGTIELITEKEEK